MIQRMFPAYVFRLLACACMALGPCFMHAQQQIRRPNILWLSVEDMSPHLGCYGDSGVPTPNLDRLAAAGIRYTRAFTTAGVCAPSRNAIITGRMQTSNGGHNMRTLNNTYPEQTGLPKSYSVVMPDGVKPFTEYLRAAGYWCTNNNKTDYQFQDGPTFWDENSNTAHYRNRPMGMPFFAVFNCNITHESQVWERGERPLRVDPARVKVPPIYPDTDSVRLDIARFLTNVSEMDDWVGERLREIETSGEAENTIVMFWSDHGDGLPWVKREVTDRGIHVPLIIRMPGGKAAVDTQIISSIDWAPTVLSLAGIRPPENMEGRPFLGRYAAKQTRRYAYAARDRLDSHYDRVRSVHDGRYQYLRNYFPEKPYYMDLSYRRQQASMRAILRLRDMGRLNDEQRRWFLPKGTEEELYDVLADPWQLHDLSRDPAYAHVLAEFRLAYEAWQLSVPDLGAIPEKSLLQQWWGGRSGPPATADPVIVRKGRRVRIQCATPGASIAYRVIGPGTDSASKWIVYQSPIVLPRGHRVEAVSHRIGYTVGKVVAYE